MTELDHLKCKSPNMTALAMQGVLLWTMNKTEYIGAHSEEERKALISKATRSRRQALKLYQDKIRNIKLQ